MLTMFLTSPWGNWTLLLAQAVTSIETRAADVVQYLIGVGVLALIGMMVRLERRLTTIETVLTRPETGLEARTVGISKRVHEHANVLTGLGFRMDTAEEGLERLDRVKVDRPLPEFGGKD